MVDPLDSKSRKKQSEPPKWLRKIQETSWEAEILISFGALIVLFQIPDYLFLLGTSMDTTMGLTRASWLVVLLNIPLIILTIGFIAHLIIRGFWAGLIAMNFSFPDGINKEKLGWRGRFSSTLKNVRQNTKVILDLEKLAGIIYGFTFLIFFIFIGVLIWLMVGLFLPFKIMLMTIKDTNIILENIISISYIIFLVLFLFSSVVYLFDFITLGWVKKRRRFSKIYYPFYKILSFITLSYFSKNLYYTLITNISKKRLLGVILGLSLVLLLIAFLTLESFSGRSKFKHSIQEFDPHSYGTFDDWNFKRATRISKRIIDNGFLEAYWVYDVNEEDSLIAFCYNKKILADSVDLESASLAVKQKCLNLFYNIYIDDTIKADINWELFTYKKKAFPFYIMTSGIDVGKLQNGHHSITFHKANNKGIKGRKMPFYISGND